MTKMTAAETQAFLAAEFPQIGNAYVIEAVGEKSATVRMKPEDRHLRPGGTVSGPTLFALADCAIYIAILANIGPEALTVTTSATIDFMSKPALGADLIAEVRILKLGRVLVVSEALIFSEGKDQPVARASMTYSIPPAR